MPVAGIDRRDIQGRQSFERREIGLAVAALAVGYAKDGIPGKKCSRARDIDADRIVGMPWRMKKDGVLIAHGDMHTVFGRYMFAWHGIPGIDLGSELPIDYRQTARMIEMLMREYHLLYGHFSDALG